MNTSQIRPTQSGNRIIFTSQQLHNGIMNIAAQQHNSGQRITYNNSMLPGVVGGLRTPTAIQQQINLQSNQMGRVVSSNSHMVGVQRPSIMFNGPNTAQRPQILLNTDSRYQLLQVGADATGGPMLIQAIGTNSTYPTQIRLQGITTNQTVALTSAQGTAQQQQLSHTTQIQTIQTYQQQNTQQSNAVCNNNNSNNVGTMLPLTTTAMQNNTREKCRKLLVNLIDLSKRQSKPVELNVRHLIQALINANVEPSAFCDNLQRLMNASPQSSLIGFLKKSLPLLRQAMFNNELFIEGIKAPPQHVLGITALQQLQLPKIQAQIRPISQSSQAIKTQPSISAPSIGQTIIRKQTANARIQATPNVARLVSPHLRAQIPASIQQTRLQAGQTHSSIVQIRGPSGQQMQLLNGVVQARTIKADVAVSSAAGAAKKLTTVKLGQTQIKAIRGTPKLNGISKNVTPAPKLSSCSSILSTINSVASNGCDQPAPTLPRAALQQCENRLNRNLQSQHNSNSTGGHATHKILSKQFDIKVNKIVTNKICALAKKAGATSSIATTANRKVDKPNVANGASVAAVAPDEGDDDINDVTAMGGVNLAEESQRILGFTQNIGTQIRSCKDKAFLNLPALQARIRALVAKRGLQEPAADVAMLISHACEERLKTIVEKLAVLAEHRSAVVKMDSQYEPVKDVRAQLKFLQELDKASQKKNDEIERENLLRAAKSRSRISDPEKAKIKARAKEMQRAQMEEMLQREANLTALQAIGPRKKRKLDSAAGDAGAGAMLAIQRPRIKRINLRDMQYYMEQERETCRSEILYKSYLK